MQEVPYLKGTGLEDEDPIVDCGFERRISIESGLWHICLCSGKCPLGGEVRQIPLYSWWLDECVMNVIWCCLLNWKLAVYWEQLYARGVLTSYSFEPLDLVATVPLVAATLLVVRNLMVFEQCHRCEVYYISDNLTLLDYLINDAKDVEMLVEGHIIENLLGNNVDVSDLFKNLCKNILFDASKFYYSHVCQQLNKHCSSKWHKHRAILRQKYFNHPWAVISIIFAIVLLLLTVIQAITGVISVIHK
ncbi:hypothetical protein Ancab_022672 [Ancistrocladus abbreviatus]